MNNLIPDELIEKKIYFIRDQKVMLDRNLAELYETETKKLNQAVKRNSNRFPEDFMFQLTEDEFNSLRSQFVTSNKGGIRYLPYAFTEHGALMLANVLKSKAAIKMSIQIIRIFNKLRSIVKDNNAILKKLDDLEKTTNPHFSQILSRNEINCVPDKIYD